MKVLVTGSSGFIGSNLINKLSVLYKDITIYKFNSKSDVSELEQYTKDCDFVFNLAAVHRPTDKSDFLKINSELFSTILSLLKKNGNKCPILYTSSIQADAGNDYGNSKVKAENDLIEFSKENGNRAIIYRLTNTFGRWARPNGHSVIATFCYNIRRDIPINVSDRTHLMKLYFIEDVVNSFIDRLNEKEDNGKIYYQLDQAQVYLKTLGEIADSLNKFRQLELGGQVVALTDPFEKKLYLTYCSYRNNK